MAADLGEDRGTVPCTPPGPPSAGRAMALLLGLLVLSLPFSALAVLTHGRPLVLGLPASVVFIAAPAALASIFSFTDAGALAVGRLWGGLLHVHGPWWAWAMSLLLPALVLLVAAGVAPALGLSMPLGDVRPAAIALSLPVFVVGGVLEEIGWTAYATRPLVDRWGATAAGAGIGAAWAAIHVIPWITMGYEPPGLVALVISTILQRIVMTWLVVRTRISIGIAVLLHASSNAVQSATGGFEAFEPVPWGIGLTACTLVAWSARRALHRARRA